MDDPVDFREYQKPGPESAFDYTRDMFFAVASIFISSIISIPSKLTSHIKAINLTPLFLAIKEFL